MPWFSGRRSVLSHGSGSGRIHRNGFPFILKAAMRRASGRLILHFLGEIPVSCVGVNFLEKLCRGGGSRCFPAGARMFICRDSLLNASVLRRAVEIFWREKWNEYCQKPIRYQITGFSCCRPHARRSSLAGHARALSGMQFAIFVLLI